MLNKEPTPDRAMLGFKDSVLANFKFLKGYGLLVVEAKTTFVRYESCDIFVNIFHGRSSFELGVEIGRLHDPKNETLSLGDIVDWAGANESNESGQRFRFQASTPGGVTEFVPRLAEVVQEYAVPLIGNDLSAWRVALELQKIRWTEYVKQTNMMTLREKAEDAWHAKDYARVVELYGPVKRDLTEIESKKLAYSEQQVVTTGKRSHSFWRRTN